jgi:phosphate transport system substrate-binding protein
MFGKFGYNKQQICALKTVCIFAFIGVFIMLFLTGCGIGKNNAPKETLFSGFIKIAVDETLVPIVNEQIDVFEAMYPRSGIVIKSTSEVEALEMLLNDSTRLAVMTRPLSEQEVSYLNSRKFFPKSIKMATDGIAFVINKKNPDSIISVAALRKILSGKSLRWAEIFPSSNLGQFSIAYDNRNSSIVRYVQDSIIFNKELSPRSFAAGSSDAVVKYVNETPGAIGIIGVNWISSEFDSITREFLNDIQVMRVSREDKATLKNSCQPYQYYLYTGEYPFTRSLYLNINDPIGGLPTGFVNFVTSGRGQRIILKAGLLPATMPVNIVNVREEL